MKKSILLLSIITLFFSCNLQEEERNLSKIKALEKAIDDQQKHIDSLQKINLKTAEEAIALDKKYTEGYVSKEYVSFFLKDKLKFATDKKQLIQFAFDHFNLQEWDLDRGIVNSYIIESPNTKEQTKYEDLSSQESLCAYILSTINRSPESLEKVITPDIKNMLVALLKKNNLYKKAGVYTIVKALLYTYQEIENDDLSRIYELASNDNRAQTQNYITAVQSEKVKNLLKNTENYTTYETWSSADSRAFLVYTFWARRYTEGNKKFVYDFLSDFHTTLTGEEVTR